MNKKIKVDNLLKLAMVVNAIFAICGFVSCIVTLSARPVLQVKFVAIMELIFETLAILISLGVIVNNLSGKIRKILIALFVVNCFIVYFVSGNFVLSVIYIAINVVLAMNVLKLKNFEQENKEQKEEQVVEAIVVEEKVEEK